MLAAERLGQGLARWASNRKAWAFYRTVSGVAMAAAQDDMCERTRQTLREAGEGARRAQEAAVEVWTQMSTQCFSWVHGQGRAHGRKLLLCVGSVPRNNWTTYGILEELPDRKTEHVSGENVGWCTTTL